jgi:hypothetical protein
MSKKSVGEFVEAYVHRSAATDELYVSCIVPSNGKFKLGDKVAVGIIHWSDRPKATPKKPKP